MALSITDLFQKKLMKTFKKNCQNCGIILKPVMRIKRNVELELIRGGICHSGSGFFAQWPEMAYGALVFLHRITLNSL